MFLTIFTPTYNRAALLPRLYESLKKQSDLDFEWLIVDDGSTDNTEEVVKSFLTIENQFEIRYFKQPNGGKHRAVNRGVNLAVGVWFFIVDSDDWLPENSVEIIKRRIIPIQDDRRFCGITGLKVTDDGVNVGTKCDYDILDSDFFSYRHLLKIQGDRAEVVRTSIMKEFPFPEFQGERFLTEATVWTPMSAKYMSRYTSDNIYFCEYQPEGLTYNYQKLLRKNPLGYMYYSKVLMSHPKCSLGEKIRQLLNYEERKVAAKQKGVEIPSKCLLPLKYRIMGRLTTPALRFIRKIRKLR